MEVLTAIWIAAGASATLSIAVSVTSVFQFKRWTARDAMPSLQDFRFGKPGHTPDQSIYAEYACAEFGLTFQEIDGGTGLVFSVASTTKSLWFGAGRCSWY